MLTVEKDVSDLVFAIEKAETAIAKRIDMKSEFTSLKENILEWLSTNEILISDMDPVAISVDVLKKQIDLLNVSIFIYISFSTSYVYHLYK